MCFEAKESKPASFDAVVLKVSQHDAWYWNRESIEGLIGTFTPGPSFYPDTQSGAFVYTGEDGSESDTIFHAVMVRPIKKVYRGGVQ